MTQQPRVLVCGEAGAGQNHLGPALLHALEGLPVHAIGLSSLLSDAAARSPEEAVVHALLEARRAAPSILYLPHLQVQRRFPICSDYADSAPAGAPQFAIWRYCAGSPPAGTYPESDKRNAIWLEYRNLRGETQCYGRNAIWWEKRNLQGGTRSDW
jgi:hypothetical protein